MWQISWPSPWKQHHLVLIDSGTPARFRVCSVPNSRISLPGRRQIRPPPPSTQRPAPFAAYHPPRLLDGDAPPQSVIRIEQDFPSTPIEANSSPGPIAVPTICSYHWLGQTNSSPGPMAVPTILRRLGSIRRAASRWTRTRPRTGALTTEAHCERTVTWRSVNSRHGDG